jgi:hypothetical protein
MTMKWLGSGHLICRLIPRFDADRIAKLDRKGNHSSKDLAQT